MTERLREIEQRCEKATQGPWEFESSTMAINIRGCDTLNRVVESAVAGKDVYEQHCRHIADFACTRGKVEREEDNGQFVAHAREDIPYLLGVIKAQQFKLKHMEINHNVEMMKLQRELNHAHFRELSSNGEHSEDAKPLDGTVQE